MTLATRAALLVVAAGLAAACGASSAVAPATSPPLAIIKAEGSEPSRLVLSSRAAERLGIEIAAVEAAGGGTRTVVPYAAIVYDASGAAWVYTNPEGYLFVRAGITVDRIDGARAVLVDGPPVGTRVATVGVAELYGAEHGVGGGH